MMNISRSQAQLQKLGALLQTASGRMKMAAALGPSLRHRRDYKSIARKALMVEVLPDGALPIYDKEFDETGQSFVEAFVVGEEGGDVVRVVKPKRVTVPTFEIVANPMIPIVQIKERRFDVVERSLNLAKSEIGATEDGYVFGLLDAIATSAAGKDDDDPIYNVDQSVNDTITVAAMADAYGQVERFDISVSLTFLNPRNYTDLRKWTDATVDRETERKLLKTGIMGYLWGGTLLQSRKVTRNQFYVLGDAEFLGVIPERIPLTVMSADQPLLRALGFSVFEDLGVLIFNPSAVQRVLIV